MKSHRAHLQHLLGESRNEKVFDFRSSAESFTASREGDGKEEDVKERKEDELMKRRTVKMDEK